jgi:hypothetical protein
MVSLCHPRYASQIVTLFRCFSEDTGYHHNISLRGPGSGRYQGTDWQQTTSHPYRCIHRGCLSTLCRRTNANPRLAWEGLTPVDDRSPELNDPGSFSDYITDHGLIDKLTYHYDRTGQSFDYVQWCQVDGVDYYDLASLDELQWILARPDVFPKLQTRMPCTCTVRSVIDESVPSMRVFTVPELLNTILSFLLDISDQALADAVMELESDEHDPAPVVQSTATLLALSEVDWFFFHTVVCERQGLFLRLARLYGWMLPATPADWASWRSEQPLDSRLGTRRDWREYVLQHLRGEDPHAKSRRRIFSMVTQCVKGVDSNSNSQMPGWQWALQVGEPGYRPGFTVPKAWSWEITGGSKEKDHADGEEEEHFRSDRGKGEAEANNDEEE